jgi:hypothetical protein
MTINCRTHWQQQIEEGTDRWWGTAVLVSNNGLEKERMDGGETAVLVSNNGLKKGMDKWWGNGRPITPKHNTATKSQRNSFESLAFCFDKAGFAPLLRQLYFIVPLALCNRQAALCCYRAALRRCQAA